MKNEEFDDAIREKLESINQTYTDEEVERVFQHVGMHHPHMLLRWFVNSWFIAPISVAAMISATYWSTYNFNQGAITYNNGGKGSEVFEKISADSRVDSNRIGESTLLAPLPFHPVETGKIENLDIVIKSAYYKVDSVYQPKPKDEDKILSKGEGEDDTLSVYNLKDRITLNEEFQKAKLFQSSFRVLAGVPMNNQSYKVGASCELLLGNRIGFSAGVRYSRMFTEKYRNHMDLLKHKHQNIRSRIEKYASAASLTEIALQNSLLQIPVFVNFYYPMRANTRLSLALGTNIDFYLQQNVSYTHLDNLHPIRDQFKTSSAVDPLNNVTFAVGVEKRWGSFGLQVRPFISYQLKAVQYKPNRAEYGTEFCVTYSFLRKAAY